MIRRVSGLVVEERTDLRRGGNDDVIATDDRRRVLTITRIVFLYDQTDTQSGERPAQKLNWQSVIQHGGTILAGDFNAHSTRWVPRCKVQRDATFWEDVIDEHGLEIGNDGRATHHLTREGHEGESVFDLTLANQPITKYSTLSDNHSTGSDHEVIEW